jgi:hypothetical protein
MKLKQTGKRIINDSPSDRFGVYMWRMPNGSYIADEDHNFLSISAEYGDPVRISKLKAAVKSFGITEGHEVFFPGHRKINDEQYEEQLARAKAGLVPDPDDVGALIDDMKLRGQANG